MSGLRPCRIVGRLDDGAAWPRPRIDRIAREPFERARALEPADAGESHPLRFVSCGRPLVGHEVRIVDASGQVVTDRQEGRISSGARP